MTIDANGLETIYLQEPLPSPNRDGDRRLSEPYHLSRLNGFVGPDIPGQKREVENKFDAVSDTPADCGVYEDSIRERYTRAVKHEALFSRSHDQDAGVMDTSSNGYVGYNNVMDRKLLHGVPMDTKRGKMQISRKPNRDKGDVKRLEPGTEPQWRREVKTKRINAETMRVASDLPLTEENMRRKSVQRIFKGTCHTKPVPNSTHTEHSEQAAIVKPGIQRKSLIEKKSKRNARVHGNAEATHCGDEPRLVTVSRPSHRVQGNVATLGGPDRVHEVNRRPSHLNASKKNALEIKRDVVEAPIRSQRVATVSTMRQKPMVIPMSTSSRQTSLNSCQSVEAALTSKASVQSAKRNNNENAFTNTSMGHTTGIDAPLMSKASLQSAKRNSNENAFTNRTIGDNSQFGNHATVKTISNVVNSRQKSIDPGNPRGEIIAAHSSTVSGDVGSRRQQQAKCEMTPMNLVSAANATVYPKPRLGSKAENVGRVANMHAASGAQSRVQKNMQQKPERFVSGFETRNLERDEVQQMSRNQVKLQRERSNATFSALGHVNTSMKLQGGEQTRRMPYSGDRQVAYFPQYGGESSTRNLPEVSLHAELNHSDRPLSQDIIETPRYLLASTETTETKETTETTETTENSFENAFNQAYTDLLTPQMHDVITPRIIGELQ